MSTPSNGITNQSVIASEDFLKRPGTALSATTPDPYAAVPHVLKAYPNWVAWRTVVRDSKPTKVPFDVKTGHPAKANDPATWATFEQALGATDVFSDSTYDGVGFELHGTNIVGIDFDNAINAEGVIEPFALAILKILGSPYTEISPSRTGLHTFVECDVLPEGGRKLSHDHRGIEIYHGREGGRYFTMTGDKVLGHDIPVISDMALPYLLITQNRDKKFKALWVGDTSAQEGDDSSADFALMVRLAALTQNDPVKMEKFFGFSALAQRGKWDRADYRQRTIAAAIKAAKATDKTTSSRELEFHLPAVETGTHRDYVISPAPGQKDGWFPLGAVSLVGGPSGGSKTTWMLQLLIAQALKVPFYGHDTYGRTFLMLGADRGEDAHRRTMERMNLSLASVPFKPLPLAWDLGAAQAIVDQIEATDPLPEIVFIEGVDMLVTDVNNIKAVAYFVHALQKIAQHYRVAVIGSLGSPKAKEGHGYTATRDNLLGSSGWGRTVETVALLSFPKNDDTSGRRQLTVVLRNAAAEKFPLKFVDGLLEVDPDSHDEDNDVGQASKDTEWYQAQALLAKKDPSKKWFTILDIERALKMAHATADRHVRDSLAKKYLIQKPGKKNGRGSAAEYRWNESRTNPLWVEQQKQETAEQIEAF